MADEGAKIYLSTALKLRENYSLFNQTDSINLYFKSFNDQKMTPKFFKLRKKEIRDSIEIWNDLIIKSAYEVKDADKLFLNYKFGQFPELDSINVLIPKNSTRKNPRKVFFNIETKDTKPNQAGGDYKSVYKSLNIQLKNRINSQLRDILNGEKMDIVSIGYIDGKFEIGKHAEYIMSKDKHSHKYSKTRNFKSEKTFLSWFKNYAISPFAEQIIENYSKSMLTQNMISNIKRNVDSVTFNETQDTFFNESIKSFINDKNSKVLFVNAPAGSGKTVMASRTYYYLKQKRKDTKPTFLIMNKKFFARFFTVDDSNGYNGNRITFGTNYVMNKFYDSDILIVDEAQRLSFDDLGRYVNHFKKVILFGDDRQIFMSTDEFYKDFPTRLRRLLNDGEGILIQEVNLKDHVRYSNDQVPKFVNAFVLGEKVTKKFDLKKFKVNVFISKEEFFKELDSDYSNLNKTTGFFHLYNSATYYEDIKRPLIIGDRSYTELSFDSQFPYLSKNRTEYIGNTQHAISFDMDNVYIYLNNARVDKYNKNKSIIIYDRFEEFCKENEKKYWDNNEEKRTLEWSKIQNQPYILMSRAIEKINILVEDLETYKKMKHALTKLIKK